MCVRVFLCVGLIPRPRSPTNCPNRFISSEVRLLNRNRPLVYTLKEDDDDEILVDASKELSRNKRIYVYTCLKSLDFRTKS